MAVKPFYQSCENNKKPILEQLKVILKDKPQVLEIGTGSAQHALYFASQLPHLQWQTSDRAENIEGIQSWLTETTLTNVLAPWLLEIGENTQWPTQKFDAIFSANTCHIMAWEEVVAMFHGLYHCLKVGGVLIQYGPFNHNHQFTSESNANFDQWLKQQGEHMGIRDISDLEKLANENKMQLIQQITMPSNNQILVWELQR